MKYLILLERVVLESLGMSPKTVYEVRHDTGIDDYIVINILNNLVTKGLVDLVDETYKINFDNFNSFNLGYSAEPKSNEVSELLGTAVTGYFKKRKDTHLNLKKVHMTPREKNIYNSMLMNLNNFLKELEKNKNRNTIQTQTVVFWGDTSYKSLIDSFLAT